MRKDVLIRCGHDDIFKQMQSRRFKHVYLRQGMYIGRTLNVLEETTTNGK